MYGPCDQCGRSADLESVDTVPGEWDNLCRDCAAQREEDAFGDAIDRAFEDGR